MHQSDNKEEIKFSYILKVLAVLLLFVAVAFGSSFLLFDWLKVKKGEQTFKQAEFKPNEPLLESTLSEKLAQLRKEEAAILGSYAWVDRDNEIIRIPIDRATALMLKNDEFNPPPPEPEAVPAPANGVSP